MKITGAALLALASAENMNGRYQTASIGNIKTTFNDDYSSKGYEYFDVWAPEIATHYGEVFWTDQGTHPLPDKIVQRFKGKVMAMVGYEQDQVMVTPTGQPGVNPEKDVSVPINWAYNHHYTMWLTGAHSEMKEVHATNEQELWENHGQETRWAAVDKENSTIPRNFADVAPTSQFISEGNGGESRKSFHGYPDGFAQLIESPDSWHITPMQIDTRNRECGVTAADVHNCTRFSDNPGPEPKQARYGRGIPKDSQYSGVLECPCTSNFGGDPMFYPVAKTKVEVSGYNLLPSGACVKGHEATSAEFCFTGAASLGVNATQFINLTVSDSTLPSGCSVVTHANGSATSYFNTAGDEAGCKLPSTKAAGGTSVVGVAVTIALDYESTGKATMARSAKGEWCEHNKDSVIKHFPAASDSTLADSSALAACEAFCVSTEGCNACSVNCQGDKLDQCEWNALKTCGLVNKWGGKIDGDVSIKQHATTGNATITLSGPADGYFAVGLDAKIMSDKPYTLVVNSSGVHERKLGTCGTEADHCAGDVLSTSVRVISSSVAMGRRSIVLSRSLQGLTKDHYSFDYTALSQLNVITAIGNGQVFGYHKAHAAAALAFTAPAGTATCVCDAGVTGQLCGNGGSGCDTFTKACVAAPAGSLLEQRNPTCNSGQYAGGLRCCKHGRTMLDQEQQAASAAGDVLRYHMKIRFWFQEYKPEGASKTPQGTTKNTTASHYDLPRIYQQTEANAMEYDIPPAFATKEYPHIPGYNNHPISTGPNDLHLTPGSTCTGNCPYGDDCRCQHQIHYTWTVGPMRLIYAGGHCHAPACIGIWLYRNDTGHEGELLCHQAPVYGSGNVTHDKYDEAGYLALPPCLWGDDAGLSPSVLLPKGTQIYSIKKNWNHDTGHFGEMASWQMRGIDF